MRFDEGAPLTGTAGFPGSPVTPLGQREGARSAHVLAEVERTTPNGLARLPAEGGAVLYVPALRPPRTPPRPLDPVGAAPDWHPW